MKKLSITDTSIREGGLVNFDHSVGSYSSGKTLKRNLSESSFCARVIGDGKHCYECEQCNVGGELLYCSSCPRTYHLKCLNPPLQVVPEGKWYCSVCAIPKCVPRRARTKRLKKKSTPEKVVIPQRTKSFKKEKTSFAHDVSHDEPNSSSSRQPLLVRLKLGTSNKPEEKKPVQSDSRDSAMKEQMSEVDTNNSYGKKSLGDEKNDSDKKSSSSRAPLLIRLKLRHAEKSKEKKPLKLEVGKCTMIEKKSKGDENNDSDKKSRTDNGSDKKFNSDYSGSSSIKRQKNLHEFAQRSKKEQKKGLPTREKNQEMQVEVAPSSTHRQGMESLVGSEATMDGLSQASFPPVPSIAGQQSVEPVTGPSTSFTSVHEKLAFPGTHNTCCPDHNRTLSQTQPPENLVPTIAPQALQLDQRQLVHEISTGPMPNRSSTPNDLFSQNSNMPALPFMQNIGQISPPGCAWSEDELDSLWIGVRRHGHGHWDRMLEDLKLTFSKNKTPKDLTAKWQEERLKVLNESGSKLSKPVIGQDFSDAKLETSRPSFCNTFVLGSSTSSDVGPHDSAGLFLGSSSSRDLSSCGGAGSLKLDKLPHWMRDTFCMLPPPPPVPAGPMLPSTASALSSGME